MCSCTSLRHSGQALLQASGIDTPLEAVKTAEFPRPARRPRFSALASARRPAILLPPWQQGVADFVAARRALVS